MQESKIKDLTPILRNPNYFNNLNALENSSGNLQLSLRRSKSNFRNLALIAAHRGDTERPENNMKQLCCICMISINVLLIQGCGSPFYMGQHPSTWYRESASDIPQNIASLEKIAIRPSNIRPRLIVDRDHEGPTGDEVVLGTLAGIDFAGEMVSEDASGVLLLPIVLPLAMVAGAISGSMRAEIMEAQKESADQLLKFEHLPIPSEVMAEQVQSYFAEAPVIDSVLITAADPAPDDVDAIMTIEVQSLHIGITGHDASMTLTAVAELRGKDRSTISNRRVFNYTVKNTVTEWVVNDSERWNEFVNDAIHYFATRISEELFQKIRVRHVLRPIDTDTRTHTPMLAWELILLGGDNYADWEQPIEAEEARYTLEIYQADRLVYSANHIDGTRHTVQKPLPACTSFRWSVPPIYPMGNKTRAGNWMRERSFGLVIAETVPHVTLARNQRKHYPKFKTPCRAIK